MAGPVAGWYIMQAVWCAAVAVLTILYCIQMFRWIRRSRRPDWNNHKPSTTTVIFLSEATVVLALWIAKAVDPYSVIGLNPHGFTEFVATIVPPSGLIISASIILSLLHSVATTSKGQNVGAELHFQRIQILLFAPAIANSVLGAVVTPIIYVTNSNLVQGFFQMAIAFVCMTQFVMLNYGGWRLSTTLRAHMAKMSGGDHAQIDNALAKLRKLQLGWSIVFVVAAVLSVVLGLPKITSSGDWAHANYNDPQVVEVDYFEWIIVVGFAICFFHCWTPATVKARAYTSGKESTTHHKSKNLAQHRSSVAPSQIPNHMKRASDIEIAVGAAASPRSTAWADADGGKHLPRPSASYASTSVAG